MFFRKLFIFLFFCSFSYVSVAGDKSDVGSFTMATDVDVDLIGDKKIKNNFNKTVDGKKIVDLTTGAIGGSEVVKTKDDGIVFKDRADHASTKVYRTNNAKNAKNNNDIKAVEEYIKDNYNDEFRENIEINRDYKKKDQKKPKFSIKVVDVKDTRNGNAVKNLQEAFKLYKQEDYELAVLYYQKALLQNQNSVEARFGLSVSYQKLKQCDQAIDGYLNLLNAGYSRKKIINNLLLCLESKPYEKALDILKSVKDDILGYSDISTQIGIILIKLKRNKEAIRELAQVYGLSPNDPIVAYNLGILYDRENNIDDAQFFFETAIRNGISEFLNYDDNQRLEERLAEIKEQISAKIKNSKNNKK